MVSVWLALTTAFILLRVLPGDAISAQAIVVGQSQTIIQDRQQALGLNRPVIEQYITYLGHLSRGDFGQSLVTGESVGHLLISRGGNTLRLTLGALGICIGIGTALGAIAGISSRRWISSLARAGIDLLIAIPIYVSGTVAVMSGALNGLWGAMFILGIHSAAAVANTLNSALRAEAAQGYILTAYAKGLPNRTVIWNHRLRVVIHSIVPVIAVQTGFLLGGTVITEAIFSLSGLGQSLLDAVLRRDYPVVQGWVLWMASAQAMIYALAQGMTHWLDPRLREA